jgi:hypothetical protein
MKNELRLYTSDKWDWRAFDDQVNDYCQMTEPWPEKNRLYLNAQQVIVDRAEDEGLQVNTMLRRGQHGNVMLLARIAKPGKRTVKLKLFIDRQRPNDLYTGVYYMPPRPEDTPGALEKRFRFASPTSLMRQVAEEFDEAPPMDFCTVMGWD